MRLRGNGLGSGVGGAGVVTPSNDTLAAAAVCVPPGVGGDLQLAALSADLAGAGAAGSAAKQLDKAFTVFGLGSSSAFTMVTGGAHMITSGGGSSSGSARSARLGGGVGGFAGTFSAGSCRELKISTRPLMLNCCGVVVCGDRSALGDMGGLPSGRGICVGVGVDVGAAAAGVGVCRVRAVASSGVLGVVVSGAAGCGWCCSGAGAGAAAGVLVKSKIWLN